MNYLIDRMNAWALQIFNLLHRHKMTCKPVPVRSEHTHYFS